MSFLAWRHIAPCARVTAAWRSKLLYCLSKKSRWQNVTSAVNWYILVSLVSQKSRYIIRSKNNWFYFIYWNFFGRKHHRRSNTSFIKRGQTFDVQIKTSSCLIFFGKRILDGFVWYFAAEQRNSLGKVWHPGCLRCEECGKRLNPGQHSEVRY